VENVRLVKPIKKNKTQKTNVFGPLGKENI
jgi:hypothetical protein